MIELQNKIPTTISASEEKPKAMDFDALRQQAMETIRRLSPDLWTDHNIHDPGINILEELCYAITDLAYRLEYPMIDLLAYADAKRDPYNSLPPIYDILPCMPVTLMDMRKLVIDVPGVKNAWIEKEEQPTPQFYYLDKERSLTFSATDAVPVKIAGLYKIKIQTEPGEDGATVRQEVRRHWNKYRSLAEDISSIELIGIQRVAIKLKVEIATAQNPNALIQKIFKTLTGYISPSPGFYTLEQMLAKGTTQDELFSGPLLRHGFLDDQELLKSIPRKNIRTSDLIRILTNLPEIRLVKQLILEVGGTSYPWYVDIEDGKLPFLDILESDIQLIFNGQEVGVSDKQEANNAFIADSGKYKRPPMLPIEKRFPKPPIGEYRGLKEYTSIQNHLPLIYGVGKEGLAPHEPNERKAAAKQLKAYLLFFEQILTNLHAQLEHFKDLFAYDQLPANSHFAQLLNDTVSDLDDILNPWLPIEGLRSSSEGELYLTVNRHPFVLGESVILMGADQHNGRYRVTRLNSLIIVKTGEYEEIGRTFNTPHIRYSNDQILDIISGMADPVNASNDRIHRFYDHLLARYGESLPDYSSFFSKRDIEYNVLKQFSLRQKQQFLKHYKDLSQARNKGFNYWENALDKSNVSGLQKRLQLLLGIGDGNQKQLKKCYDQIFAEIEAYYLLHTIEGYTGIQLKELFLRAITDFKNFSINDTTFKLEIHSGEGSLIATSRKPVAINANEQEIKESLLAHWKRCWEWNFSLEGMYLVEHILLRPIAADKDSVDAFYHNYFQIDSYAFVPGKTDDDGQAINVVYCETLRDKPAKVGDVVYIVGVDQKKDIRAIVFSIDSEGKGFEIRIDQDITAIDQNRGYWYYGEVEREKAAVFMALYHQIESFQVVSQDVISCQSQNHGLSMGALIDVQVEEIRQKAIVVSASEDTFQINWLSNSEEIGDWAGKTGIWQYTNAKNDPYSLQISIILPKWPGRMQNKSFRELMTFVIRNEAPAHHQLYVKWLDLDEMASFEYHHHIWLTHLEKYGI